LTVYLPSITNRFKLIADNSISTKLETPTDFWLTHSSLLSYTSLYSSSNLLGLNTNIDFFTDLIKLYYYIVLGDYAMDTVNNERSDYLKVLDSYINSTRNEVYKKAGVSFEIKFSLVLLFSISPMFVFIPQEYSMAIITIIAPIYFFYSYYLITFRVMKILKSKYSLDDIESFLKFNNRHLDIQKFIIFSISMNNQVYNDLKSVIEKLDQEISTYKSTNFLGTPVSMLFTGVIGYLLAIEIESNVKDFIIPLLYLATLLFFSVYYFSYTFRPKGFILREIKQFVLWYEDFGKSVQEKNPHND